MGASTSRCAGPVRQRQVFAPHLARGDARHQRVHGRARAGDDHQPAGVLVQAVHDAGARQLPGLVVARQQAVEQRAAPVARCWVHHQAGGLVDDGQVLVLVHHGQRHGLRHESLAHGRGAQFDNNLIGRAHLVGRFGDGAAVDLRCAAFDQLAQVVARELGHQRCQRAVQPVAMVRGGHRQRARFGGRGLVGEFVVHLGRPGAGPLRQRGRRYNGPSLIQEVCH